MLASKAHAAGHDNGYNTCVPAIVLTWCAALLCVPCSISPDAALAALRNGVLACRTQIARAEEPDLVVVWPDAAHALVLLRSATPRSATPLLVAFGRAAGASLERCPAADAPGLARTQLPAIRRTGAAVFLDVFERAGAATRAEPVVTLDAAGVRIANTVLFFPREGDHPRSVFFDVAGGESLEFLLTGMSGGAWEVWRDGGLVDAALHALPGGTLHFHGPPGNYFLRRR